MKSLHILLTLSCLYKCDHCFLFCSPEHSDVFSLGFLQEIIAEAARIKGLTGVCFEGGEPFLHYPLLLEGIKKASSLGLTSGLVSNGYWAAAGEARLWLKPLKQAGLQTLSISRGDFHQVQSDEKDNDHEENKGTKSIARAAEELGLILSWLETKKPTLNAAGELESGGIMFRGRAAEKLTENLPRQAPDIFSECPWEDLESPARLHIDPEGGVHICQGVIIGKAREKSLAAIIEDYKPADHPIIAPLIKGGPLQLARETDFKLEDGYVDACHLCFAIRQELLKAGHYKDYLGPLKVYGLSEDLDGNLLD